MSVRDSCSAESTAIEKVLAIHEKLTPSDGASVTLAEKVELREGGLGGGSKLLNESGVSHLRGIVEAGSRSIHSYLMRPRQEKIWTICTASSIPCQVSFSVLLTLGYKKKSSGSRLELYELWVALSHPF
ncbi:hypothetical protein TNCV_254991 [Trichonephila clavipes]|nr:hypothetical protein TNCV_254991 [Trichonephila clavipes]